uniref:Secreted protein n=1 Tax=Panagrolaimus sp. JU765 TaxID=591449 RepID=A0AC34QK82_9BILA
MHIVTWLIIFLMLIISLSQSMASPLIINEKAILEIIDPIQEHQIPHHKHRRHHHHKKRRSLTIKTENETSGVRQHKQMMLTKPYWPWP